MEPMESNQGFELESVVLEFEKCAKIETTGFKHHQRTRLKPTTRDPSQKKLVANLEPEFFLKRKHRPTLVSS
jgi:hypothetical protein